MELDHMELKRKIEAEMAELKKLLINE